MRIATLVLTLLLSLPGAAGELVLNGDFERPATYGWTDSAWGNFPDTGNCRLRRLHDYNPDRDFEVLVHKMLHRGYRLEQRVELPSLDLGFAASCRLNAKTEQVSFYAAAAVCLEYLDRAGTVLGETRIYGATSGCDWQGGPTLHLIPAPDTLNWYDYHLLLGEELDSLPGVARDSVEAVNVVLLGYVLDNG